MIPSGAYYREIEEHKKTRKELQARIDNLTAEIRELRGLPPEEPIEYLPEDDGVDSAEWLESFAKGTGQTPGRK